MATRRMIADDLPAIEGILAGTQLFPPEMLGGLTADFLSGENTEQEWQVETEHGVVVGFAFAETEALTDGTWNMRAIAIAGDHQQHGHGVRLVNGVELALAGRGARLLLVDTSGTDDFEPVRGFYQRLEYTEIATIPDFWAEGDAKVTFIKSLK